MVQDYEAARRSRDEAIYRRYAPEVFTYLLHHIPMRQDAEDLLVEVFLAVLEKIPSLDIDERHLAAYVQAIARNKVADYYRKRGKRQIISLDALAETAYESEELAPEERAVAGEQITMLRHAFNELPELQQTILRLRFIHGLRSREIAAHLARSENSIRVMLSRSLKSLRKNSALREERD